MKSASAMRTWLKAYVSQLLNFEEKVASKLCSDVKRGQMLEAEAEAEAKILASRPAWPRGLNITEAMCYV